MLDQITRVFHDKVKFYILRQHLHQTWFSDFSNVKWCMKQTFFKVCQMAQASEAYLDKHSTLDLVIINVVCSIPNFLLKFFKPLIVNSCLKCKCDLIEKNSIVEEQIWPTRGVTCISIEDFLDWSIIQEQLIKTILLLLDWDIAEVFIARFLCRVELKCEYFLILTQLISVIRRIVLLALSKLQDMMLGYFPTDFRILLRTFLAALR